MKMNVITSAVLLTLCLSTATDSTYAGNNGNTVAGGSVSGTVKFEGTAPKPRPINMVADKVCASQHTSTVFSEDAVISSTNTLKNVFVYIKDFKGTAPAPKGAVSLTQSGCIYKPHVLGLMVGQKLEITNDDALLHNLHGTPSVNKEFNVGQPKKGMKNEFTFDKEEVGIPIKCDVHPWMKSYLHVLKHPYFAVTDENGKFTISGVPAGTYTVEAWHEKYGTKTMTIKVTDGGSAMADFSMSKK